MQIQSGISRAKRQRSMVITVALLGLGGWFAYDGWVGYPKGNLADYARKFPPEAPPQDLKINPRVMPGAEKDLAADKTLDALAGKLGGPADLVVPVDADRNDAFWFGRSGWIKAELSRNNVQKPPIFENAGHSETDLLFQKFLGVAMVLAGLVYGSRAVRALGARYVLDDAGLHLPGQPLVGWDAMDRLDTAAFTDKGWVDLHLGGGDGRRVRLDSYDIEAFDQIIGELCRRKGFANPIGRSAPAASA